MQTRSSSSASADLVPFVNFPAGQSREAQLQIVDPTQSRGKLLPGWTFVNRPRASSRSSKGSVDSDHRSLVYASKGFRLPKGWTVEEFPRRNSRHIDKYYVEPKTGKRFRSLVSFDSITVAIPKVDGSLRGNRGAIPVKYDKSYIEPGTRKRFRYLAAVERYLNGTVDLVSPMVQSGGLSILGNPNGIGCQTVVIDPNPPEKVKWVLTGPGGNMFRAHVSGSDVSSSVEQTWSEAFVSLIQECY